jgi:ribosomal protein S6--L-glutamate ligase/tetrahydromethanopterin:alpha-L-glutamate ligase
LKIGILSSDIEEWHVLRLSEELEKREHEVYVFPITNLVSRIALEPKISIKEYPVGDYDAIIVRRVPGGSVEQVFYRMDTLHMLEEYGVHIFNSPDSIEKSVNKFYTSAILDKHGLRSPRTIVTENFREAIRGFRELGEDVIVKPIFGSLGSGMTRVSDPEIAYRVFRSLESISSVFYLQEYIPHNNTDIRIFVIGGEVVSAMKRAGKSWKTNISSGGKPMPYTPSEEEKEFSIKASEILGLDYTGVDLLPSENGELYTLEVNSTPGWEGLQKVTNKNISEEIINYIISKLN